MVHVSAGAIIRQGSKLLIVKPPYHHYWLLPGGQVEEGESPREAVKREVEEELGLSARIGPLLSIDFWWKGAEARWAGGVYVQPHDALIMLFDGGELLVRQEQQICLPGEELEDVKILEVEDTLRLLA